MCYIVQFLNPIRIIDRHASASQGAASFNQSRGFYNTTTMLKLLLRIRIPQFQNALTDALIIIMILTSNALIHESDRCKQESLRSSMMNIFNHIRWNDSIADPSYLVEKIVNEFIHSLASDKSFQIEVISSLPALLPEQNHEQLVQSLLDFLAMNSDLVPCIFDTISNLSLPKNSPTCRDALNIACEQLSLGTEKELPILVRFILDTSYDKHLAKENLLDLREKLGQYISIANPMNIAATEGDYDPLVSQRFSLPTNNAINAKQRNEFLTCINLILNSFKSSFLSNPVLITAYYKLMEERHDALTIIDLWIIFSLYSNAKFKFKLSGILLKKYSAGLLTFDSIVKALASYLSILEDLFRNIMAAAHFNLTLPLMQTRLMVGGSAAVISNPSLGTQLVGTASAKLTQQQQPLCIEEQQQSTSLAQMLGLEIYLAIYCAFIKPSHRQDIVAALIGHASSPVDYESTTALRVLSIISDCEFQLCLRQVVRTSPYSSQSNFSLHSKVFRCLATGMAMDENAATLKSFVPFLQTLVYETNKISYPQIRSVFRIIFQISIDWAGLLRHESNHQATARSDSTIINELLHYLPDEVMIILRKYIDKLNLKHKRIGVLGFISLLVVLSDFAIMETNNVPEASSSNEVIVSLQQHIFESFLVNRFDQYEDMQEFVYDELSYVLSSNFLNQEFGIMILNHSDKELSNYICFDLKRRYESTKKMWNNFVHKNRTGNRFITPSDRSFIGYGLLLQNESAMTQAAGKSLASQHAHVAVEVDQNSDNVTYANLLTKTISYHLKSNTSTYGSSSSSSMVQENAIDSNAIAYAAKVLLSSSKGNKIAAIVRLVGKSYRTQSSLDNIGQLLYAPIELPSPNLVNEIENFNILIQAIVCQSYRFAVNWMRELINTFSSWPVIADAIDKALSSTDIGRLIKRYNYLIQCECEVIMLLQRCPEVFKLMFPDNDTGSYSSCTQKTAATTMKKAVAESAPKRKKNDKAVEDENINDDGDELFNTDINSNSKVEVPSNQDSINTDNIELMVEKIYRPMTAHAAMLLGFGNKHYPLFDEGEVSTKDVDSSTLHAIIAPTSQRSVNDPKFKDKDTSSGMLRVHLSEKAQMRLLQLLLSSCKAYEKKAASRSSSHTSGSAGEIDNLQSTFLTIQEILPSAYSLRLRSSSGYQPTLGNLSIENFTAANNLSIDSMIEVEYYVDLECRHVFRYLSDCITSFCESFSDIKDHHISSSSLNISNISIIAKDPRDIHDLNLDKESTISSEDMHAKMVLVNSIVETILDSKSLKEIAINRAQYFLDHGLDREMETLPSSLASSELSIPVFFDILASLAGINYRQADSLTNVAASQEQALSANPVHQTRNTDPFRYFQMAIYGLQTKLQSLISSIHSPIFFDLVISILRIIDKLLVFLSSILGSLKDTLSPDHNLVGLLTNTYNELSAGFRNDCSNLLLTDWNASAETGKSKRRYTNKDLGFIISLHLKYQPEEQSKINRIAFFIHDALDAILPKDQSSLSVSVDMLEDDLSAPINSKGAHHVYKSLSIDQSFNIFYNILLDELCNLWRTSMLTMRSSLTAVASSSAAASAELSKSDLKIVKAMVSDHVLRRSSAAVSLSTLNKRRSKASVTSCS
jgi:hypothetical protein